MSTIHKRPDCCPLCGKHTLAVYRITHKKDYRVVDMDARKSEAGVFPYKHSWRNEETKTMKAQQLRCNACDEDLDNKHFKGWDYKITTKGLLWINNFFDTFVGDDDENAKS